MVWSLRAFLPRYGAFRDRDSRVVRRPAALESPLWPGDAGWDGVAHLGRAVTPEGHALAVCL